MGSRRNNIITWRKGYFFLLLFVVMTGLSLAENDKIPSLSNNLERARWLREQGRFEESLEILDKEINQAYSQEDSAYRAGCWLNLALDYWNLGEVSRAENAFIFAHALIKETKDEILKDYARTSLEIIKFYKKARDKRYEQEYSESEKLYKMAIELAGSKGLRDLELKCLYRLSFIYYYCNNLDDFLKSNEKALEIAKAINNWFDIARILNNIGLYYSKKKNILLSYDYFDKALIIAEKWDFLEKSPEYLINLAATSYYIGEYGLSIYYLDRALKIYEKTEDLDLIISVLSGLALSIFKGQQANNFYLEKDRPFRLLAMALEMSRQAGFKNLEARILNNLGYIYLNDEPAKAEEFCLNAWKMGVNLKDPEVIASSLNNLATIRLINNRVREAINYFQQSQEVAIKADYWSEIWKNYNGLGKCYEKLGDYRRALFNYQKALESFSQIRESIAFDLYRVGFDREKRQVYEGIIKSLVALRNDNPDSQFEEIIFSSLNMIKGRVFIEELDRLHNTNYQAGINEELSQLDQMISLLLSRPENLGDQNSLGRLLELEYRYLRLLGQDFGQNKKNNGQPDGKLSLDFIQKKILQESQALLDYFLGQQESYCFLITQNEYQIIKLPGEKEIEKTVKLYIKLLSELEISEQDLRLAGQRIGKLLLPPSLMKNDKISSLTIIPDGLLNYLPFETLVIDSPFSGNLEYLLERYRISYCPSAAALVRYQQREPYQDYKKEFLGFGNPAYGSRQKFQLPGRIYYVDGLAEESDQQLEPLPFSQQEIKQIAKLFPKNYYDIFLKKQASEENLKNLDLNQYRIIHLASHGLISEQFPQRSSLVLSSAKNSREDGFLTVREIYNLRLRAELVVLSACQSARGSIEKAEGIIGLPRVFLLDGSQAVLSSIWSVNDRATQGLMKEFYRHLLAGEAKDEALRKAKLKLIASSRSHPYYWGAFILIGDTRKIY